MWHCLLTGTAVFNEVTNEDADLHILHSAWECFALLFSKDNLVASSLFVKYTTQQVSPRYTQQKYSIYDHILNITQLCLDNQDKVLLKSMLFKKPVLCSVSQLWQRLPKGTTHKTQTSHGKAILLLAWRSRVQSYRLPFLLENLSLQQLNDFSNVKQNSFKK